MKKIFVIFLTLSLLISVLAGCGAKKKVSGEKQTEATQAFTQPPATEAAIGTLMDVPEKTVDWSPSQLYIHIVVYAAGGEEIQMEIAAKDLADGSSILYTTNGRPHTNEVVYEIAADDAVTKYIRGVGQDSFTEDTAATQTDKEAQANALMDTLDMLFIVNRPTKGIQLRKADNTVMTAINPAYGYDILENGEKIGYVCIHKETGIAVECELNGNKLFCLKDYSVDNVEIPQYK